MPPTAIAGHVDIRNGAADPVNQHPVRQNVDFFADAPYVIVFSDPAVFGVGSSNLKKGHNHLHVQVTTGKTEYRLRPQVAGATLIQDEITVASVGCGATMVTESITSFSKTAAFGPTGNILVP
jgi:hypothetical protein